MESRYPMDKDDDGSSVVYEGNGGELVNKNSSSEHIIVVRPGKPPSSNVYDKRQLFLQKMSALEGSKIPKYVVSFDEKIYLLRCLERIHVSSFKSTPRCNSSGNIGIISTGISSITRTLDIPRLAVECPFNDVKDQIAFKDMVAAAASGDSILGTISSSRSMVSILSSPLLYQLGANVDRKSIVASDVRSSPVKFVEFPPKKTKEMVKRHADTYSSRTSSSSSDKSSSSNVSDMVSSQGKLKCTWKHGLPSFVLSLDDLGEVYVANLLKIQSPDDKSMDYVYNFYSKPRGRRENEVQEFELEFVGMMEVSNSVILCPKNARTLETRFVLFGSGDYGADEPETLAHNTSTKKMIKGFRNKVTNAIRTGHGPKKTTPPSKHSSTRNVHESMPPNLELAAIIVKNHIEDAPKIQETGGWGLKFLNKSMINQTDESCECSTSMNILVPRGYHGGPRTRKEGGGGGGCPSSIIDRWSLGGHCDCGGWDVGCPLTVINSRPTRQQEHSPPSDDSAYRNAEVDLFVKGSKQNAPIMKMTNIDEDVYNIHFHSSILSPLQCLSIATAIIHNRTNSLRPKTT